MPKKNKTEKDKKPETEPVPFPTKGSTSEHSLDLPDGKLKYVSIAEWITLRKVHKPVAHMFHTAYFVKPDDKSSSRPLTFVFNGGPGAASAYLHMGALGPKRVAFGATGTLPQPPTQVVDNLESWLAFTDLVFIDPIGTGFSRAMSEQKKEAKPKPEEAAGESSDPKENPEFWEVDKDLDSLGEFISRFLSKHHRWTSPCFIAGESYGGFRVAKMARKLQEDHGVGLCGALLISPAIELDALWGTDYDLNYWIELFPSLVAAAHQHGRTQNPDASRDEVLSQAESFAHNELARWLVQGEAFPDEERNAVVATMSNLVGLPADVLERAAGRVTSTIFCRELLREQRRLIGHYDASITTVDPFPDRHDYEGPDPTLFSIDRLFTSAVNHHLRSNLKVETDLDYRLLSMQVNESWKDESQKHFFRKMTGAMDDLRYGMSLNAHMKVFISHGLFDLVTPYFSSQRLVRLMKMTDQQRENLITRNYPGGHMFYSWDDSRLAFCSDGRNFYASAMGRPD